MYERIVLSGESHHDYMCCLGLGLGLGLGLVTYWGTTSILKTEKLKDHTVH